MSVRVSYPVVIRAPGVTYQIEMCKKRKAEPNPCVSWGESAARRAWYPKSYYAGAFSAALDRNAKWGGVIE